MTVDIAQVFTVVMGPMIVLCFSEDKKSIPGYKVTFSCLLIIDLYLEITKKSLGVESI